MAKRGRKPVDNPRIQIGFRVRSEINDKIKEEMIKQDCTVTEVGERAFDKYFGVKSESPN